MLSLKRWRKRQGFTLIEMLIVIVVIGVLASIIVPKLFGAASQAKQKARLADIQELQNAVNLYEADYGSWPANLTVLTTTNRPGTSTPYLDSVPTDPVTGEAFQYDANTGQVSAPG
ncbi:MAG TPA: prepilin-type N-terminal cleavage/methylation domain-containing protein [Armatimonadetes bacterium]|nr:prepilin-type N-terminal cleavage/methylation domain-containing protein [Armatimonadota bacterium]